MDASRVHAFLKHTRICDRGALIATWLPVPLNKSTGNNFCPVSVRCLTRKWPEKSLTYVRQNSVARHFV